MGLVGDVQYDAPPSMAALAQCVGEACLAQGEDPAQRDFDLSLVNQLSDGLQAFARGAGTSEKQRADAKLTRFLLRWLPRCGNKHSPPFHYWPHAFEGLSTHRVHYEIYVMDDLLKRCGGIINYHFRAQGAHKVHIGRPGGPDQAVVAPPEIAAAPAKPSEAGLRAMASAEAVVYSAYVPWLLRPKTACPDRKVVTPGPTSSTIPAKALPGM